MDNKLLEKTIDNEPQSSKPNQNVTNSGLLIDEVNKTPNSQVEQNQLHASNYLEDSSNQLISKGSEGTENKDKIEFPKINSEIVNQENITTNFTFDDSKTVEIENSSEFSGELINEINKESNSKNIATEKSKDIKNDETNQNANSPKEEISNNLQQNLDSKNSDLIKPEKHETILTNGHVDHKDHKSKKDHSSHKHSSRSHDKRSDDKSSDHSKHKSCNGRHSKDKSSSEKSKHHHRDKDRDRHHRKDDRHRDKDRDKNKYRHHSKSSSDGCKLSGKVEKNVTYCSRGVQVELKNYKKPYRDAGSSRSLLKLLELKQNDDSKYSKYFYIEKDRNGHALVLHCFQKELENLSESEMKDVVDEFISEAFKEDDNCNAKYVLAIVHRAVKYIPDLLDYIEMIYPNMNIKTSHLTRPRDIETMTLRDYRQNVIKHYSAGTFKFGPLNPISLVGAVHEEVGEYSPQILGLLQKNPFLNALMPWGRCSSLEGIHPTKSNDGPILWIRPGEQVVPTAELPKKRSLGKLEKELSKLHMMRTTETRETLVEDRTKPHVDYVDAGPDLVTTAAVGVLKAIHAGESKSTLQRVTKEVVAFNAKDFQTITNELLLDLHEPPTGQCTYWVGDAKLNDLRKLGVSYAQVKIYEDDIYFIPRNVIHQFKTITATTSIAWHVRLKQYSHDNKIENTSRKKLAKRPRSRTDSGSAKRCKLPTVDDINGSTNLDKDISKNKKYSSISISNDLDCKNSESMLKLSKTDASSKVVKKLDVDNNEIKKEAIVEDKLDSGDVNNLKQDQDIKIECGLDANNIKQESSKFAENDKQCDKITISNKENEIDDKEEKKSSKNGKKSCIKY